jgi:hypothetical protein
MFILETGYLLVRDESTVVEPISLHLACKKKKKKMMMMMMMIVVIIIMMMMIAVIIMIMMMCGVSRQTMDGMVDG